MFYQRDGTDYTELFLSHAKSAEGADYLFINVIALIHTEGLDSYGCFSRTQNTRKAQKFTDLL